LELLETVDQNKKNDDCQNKAQIEFVCGLINNEVWFGLDSLIIGICFLLQQQSRLLWKLWQSNLWIWMLIMNFKGNCFSVEVCPMFFFQQNCH